MNLWLYKYNIWNFELLLLKLYFQSIYFSFKSLIFLRSSNNFKRLLLTSQKSTTKFTTHFRQFQLHRKYITWNTKFTQIPWQECAIAEKKFVVTNKNKTNVIWIFYIFFYYFVILKYLMRLLMICHELSNYLSINYIIVLTFFVAHFPRICF